MRRLLALAVISLAATSCIPFQQSSSGGGGQSGGGASAGATPTGPILRALWVLSPVGLKLRDAPNSSGKQIGTLPQGTQVTATTYQSNDVGWYQVNYQGQNGWIAAKDNKSTPPQDLVSTHPQLSYSNPGAGYYLLYPANWQISDKGSDVEVDQSQASPSSGQTPTSSQTATSGLPQPGSARMIVHQTNSLDQLGNVPTTAGSNLSQNDWEIGGLTAIKRTFQLSGGGYEGDLKVQYAKDRAILITFRGAAQSDLDTWSEILESFGFSVPPPGAQPSASPSH
jgi:hypothetical protein